MMQLQKITKSKLVLGLYIAVMVLLPFSRLAELPILILGITGIVGLYFNWSSLKNNPQFKILSLVFFSYFTMVAISALDSFWQIKTWVVAFSSLRFYLAGISLILYLKPKHFTRLIKYVSFIAVFWSVDALIQNFIGFNLVGFSSYEGRLTGIFGEQNVKLGTVLALLLPIMMIALKQYNSLLRWLVVFVVIIVILLSGTRSAWIMMGFILATYWFHHVKQRRFTLLLKTTVAGIVMLVSLWFISPEFQQRIERTMTLFDGSEAGVDFALADRLPIWKTSLNMIKNHPVNGVGAHAFRKAYPEYALANDVWQKSGGVGLHAHNWILEVLTDTGLIGLLLMIFAVIKLLFFSRNNYNSDFSWAFLVSLIAAFLPIISSYSIFASFWSICVWFVGAGLVLVSNKGNKDHA